MQLFLFSTNLMETGTYFGIVFVSLVTMKGERESEAHNSVGFSV